MVELGKDTVRVPIECFFPGKVWAVSGMRNLKVQEGATRTHPQLSPTHGPWSFVSTAEVWNTTPRSLQPSSAQCLRAPQTWRKMCQDHGVS